MRRMIVLACGVVRQEDPASVLENPNGMRWALTTQYPGTGRSMKKPFAVNDVQASRLCHFHHDRPL